MNELHVSKNTNLATLYQLCLTVKIINSSFHFFNKKMYSRDLEIYKALINLFIYNNIFVRTMVKQL